MRLRLSIVVLAWLSASCMGATLKPEVDGNDGQRAFDDLAALYDQGTAIAAVDAAFNDLAGNMSPAKAAAGRYILALLKQSLADEDNGRAQWKAQPWFGGGSESASRNFRGQLAEKIASGSHAAELLDAELWLIKSDRLAPDAEAGAKALIHNPSPGLINIYRSLLSPVHPNTVVTVTILKDIADRKLTALAPEVTILCNDFRVDVRNAARTASEALGIKTIPPFDPENALTGFVQRELQTISTMVYTPIPKDALWKRFSVKHEVVRDGQPDHDEFSGWLLSTGENTYQVLNLFGDELQLPKLKTTYSDRTLADDVQSILKARTKQEGNSRNDPMESLSSRGGLTGQFEPRFVSLPEALLATWTLERGDRKDAAALILPCYDRAEDMRWIHEAVRDLLAKYYHQRMLDAFTHDRDYAAVDKFAHHLGADSFKGWQYYERTQELAHQLSNRAEDFKTLVLPTPDEWKSLQTRLDRPAQAKYLAQHLRLLNAFQWGQPGGVSFEDPQTREPQSTLPRNADKPAGTLTINPLVEFENMHLEVKELVSILPSLDDDNFVLAYGYWRDFHPERTLYRVNEFIAGLMNQIAVRKLIDWQAYQSADVATRKTMQEQAKTWITANAGRTRTALLLENVRTLKDANAVIAAARELSHKNELAVLPLIFARINDLPEPDDQASLAECCFHLAPEKSVEQARQWLNKSGDLRFWAAMILFVSGDKTKNEGFPELKEALTKKDAGLMPYTRAFDTLLKSKRPEALDLAANVFSQFEQRPIASEVQPFVQRLFLAGRKEALDYLLTALDDKTPGGTMYVTSNGKENEMEFTRGDAVADDMRNLRKDDYRYPRTASEADRAVEREKLKQWLKDQMDLIHAGKESGIRTEPMDFLYSNWTIDAPR